MVSLSVLLRFFNVFNFFFKIQKTQFFTFFLLCCIRFLEQCCKGNYSATSINMKLVHWPSMGGLRGTGWAARKWKCVFTMTELRLGIADLMVSLILLSRELSQQ